MTLQASGTISLSDLAAEYGGTAPHSLSEYYRGAAYVPNTVSETNNEYTAYYLYTNNRYKWCTIDQSHDDARYAVTRWKWDNAMSTSQIGWNTNVVNSGGYTYNSSGGGSGYHSIRRYGPTTVNVSVNQTVPTSGTTDLADYYSGRKS